MNRGLLAGGADLISGDFGIDEFGFDENVHPWLSAFSVLISN